MMLAALLTNIVPATFEGIGGIDVNLLPEIDVLPDDAEISVAMESSITVEVK